MINRAQLRGKPLDKDCYRARRTTNEYGPEDDRVYCFGLYGYYGEDDLLDKCEVCGAHVRYVTPLEGGAE